MIFDAYTRWFVACQIIRKVYGSNTMLVRDSLTPTVSRAAGVSPPMTTEMWVDIRDLIKKAILDSTDVPL